MDFKIQNIKIQLKNIESLLNNISMMINMPNPNTKNQLENISIQMLNLGIEIFNTSLPFIGITNTLDSINQLNNISLQIQNLINTLNNNNMFNNNNFNIPIIPPQPIMPINNNFNNFHINNNIDDDNIYIITFKTTQGKSTPLSLDGEITVGKMLEKYLIRIERPDLINSNEISFIFNAQKVRFNDKTKIKDLFGIRKKPVIVANIGKPLIGG